MRHPAQRRRRRITWVVVIVQLISMLTFAGLSVLPAAPAQAQATAPGGVVTNLVQWYKADAEVYADTAGTTPATVGGDVNLWRNVAQAAYDVSDSSGGAPTYQAASATSNFNPALFLNKYEADYLKYTGRVMPVTASGTVLAVGRLQGVDDDIYPLASYGENANDPTIAEVDIDGGVPYFDPWVDGSSPANNDHTFPIANNQSHIMGSTWQNDVNDSLVKRVDGQPVTTNMEVVSGNGNMFLNFWIGGDGGGERWNGAVNEVVAYDTELTGIALQQVESYLAVKWGLTLDNDPTSATVNYDYVSSKGTVIWPGNSSYQSYHNDVAGIGRDDVASLNQKQSQSVNSDAIVTMGLGAIAASNAANPNSFAADRSFLLWGNDNGDVSYNASYTPNSFVPVANVFRMGRTWRVLYSTHNENRNFLGGMVN